MGVVASHLALRQDRHDRHGRCRWAARLLKSALLAAALSGLAGCGSLNLGRSSLETVRAAMTGGKTKAAPTAAAVAASPYAQIEVRGPDGNAVLLLGSVDDGRQAFYSGDRRIVYLRDGLLTATTGLASDAAQIRIEGDNPFVDLRRVQQPTQVRRRYDWMPGYRYGAQVTGVLQRVGEDSQEILGARRELLHFRETLEGPGVRGANEYWADPRSGFIWKSRQMVAPDLFLEIVQLKPYRAAAAAAAP